MKQNLEPNTGTRNDEVKIDRQNFEKIMQDYQSLGRINELNDLLDNKVGRQSPSNIPVVTNTPEQVRNEANLNDVKIDEDPSSRSTKLYGNLTD